MYTRDSCTPVTLTVLTKINTCIKSTYQKKIYE